MRSRYQLWHILWGMKRTEILMGMVSGIMSLAFFLIGTMLGALA